MLSDLSPSNPYENLAVEEALNTYVNPQPTFRLWVNKPSVVLGRFQSVASEVNVGYCLENSIAIVRRHTGGGTVYQDEGNLNMTLLLPQNSLNDIYVCYDVLSEVVIKTLGRFNLRAVRGDLHEVLINGRKVSGMAGSRTSYSVLCHSTLLVDSDLIKLRNSLKRLKKEVTTVSSEVKSEVTLDEVYTQVVEVLKEVFKDEVFLGCLTEGEVSQAEYLLMTKYVRDSWNFKEV